MRYPLVCRVLIVFVLAGLARPVAAGELDNAVRELAAVAGLAPDQYGVSIIDTATGAPIAEVSHQTAFIPASNQKLLASGAALVVLGCDFAFQTDFVIDGDRLIVRGSGDPSLGDSGVLERLTPPTSVSELLTELTGAITDGAPESFSEIVLDDRVFDRERVHQSWPVEQLNRWYCAEVDGITFHANVVRVFPSPSPDGPGSPPLVRLQPEMDWLTVNNRAKTIARGDTTAWVSRPRRSNSMTLFGNVPRPAVVDVATHEPSLLFGRLLADRLEQAGHPVTNTQRFRLVEEREDTSEGRIAARVSSPLTDIVRRCNEDSYNLYAEAMLKRIAFEVTGEPGGFESGGAVVRMTIRDLVGASAAAATIVADGSGMSRENRISPASLTAWLDAMEAHPDAGACFLASLPTVGEGSLRNRFVSEAPEAELRAKTGSLNGVRCLSGYLTDPSSGRQLAFSVLCNNLKAGSAHRAARNFHERIVLLADAWLTDQRRGAFGG
ncbi:MAG: D-alanyl-D-alanine carboxypeptidase/D-alanyl-D-alanine-endopeptidase [Planctomycetota bacterium]